LKIPTEQCHNPGKTPFHRNGCVSTAEGLSGFNLRLNPERQSQIESYLQRASQDSICRGPLRIQSAAEGLSGFNLRLNPERPSQFSTPKLPAGATILTLLSQLSADRNFRSFDSCTFSLFVKTSADFCFPNSRTIWCEGRVSSPILWQTKSHNRLLHQFCGRAIPLK